jgi:hypothetical protein
MQLAFASFRCAFYAPLNLPAPVCLRFDAAALQSCIRSRVFAEEFNQVAISEAHEERVTLFSCKAQILSQCKIFQEREREATGETKYLSYVILLGAVVLFT